MKLKDCSDCSDVNTLEYGFTQKQAHSWNHLYRFGDFKKVLYALSSKVQRRKPLITKRKTHN